MKKLYTIKNSKLHGKGLFAKQNIKAGTNVVEYVGEKITKAQSDKIAEAQLEKSQKNVDEGQVYIFTLDNKYDINGNVSYNNARLMNHSCNPNCDTDIVDGKIWIRSFRDIKKGDELTYDYGFVFDVDDFRDHVCKCGSRKCVGFIVTETDWKKLRKYLLRLAKNCKKANQ
jgi:SET domain-containing protein